VNNARRKDIAKARALVQSVMDLYQNRNPEAPLTVEAFRTDLNSAASILNGAASEEEDYLSNMPEALANGSKGDQAQEDIDNLNEAEGHVRSAIDAVEDASDEVQSIAVKHA
jgi:flagellar biosynthesis chaperone FliJ